MTQGGPYDIVIVDKVYKSCMIVIEDQEWTSNRYDSIRYPRLQYNLGMDWLSRYHAKLDCLQKMVIFLISESHPVIFVGIKK